MTADDNKGLDSKMDPWGGGNCGADAVAASDAIKGFDDNFTDDTSVTLTRQAAAFDAERGHYAPTSVALDSSSSSLPKISPINFIPRVHVDVDQAPSTTATTSFSNGPLYPALPPLKDPLTQMMSSEEYISRLEAKLRRIKGGDGAGPGKGRGRGGKKGFSSTAKQMIDALGTAKESSVLLSTDGSDVTSDSSRIDVNPHFLMQRAFPERTPLTQEELEWLVKHDQLQASDDDVEQ